MIKSRKRKERPSLTTSEPHNPLLDLPLSSIGVATTHFDVIEKIILTFLVSDLTKTVLEYAKDNHLLHTVAIYRAVTKRENLFLTGGGGVGKTHTLKKIVEALREKKLRVFVTALTGLAATHLCGTTLHGFLGVGLAKDPIPELVCRAKRVKSRWKECDVLVIDEISMLDAVLLSVVDQLGRQLRDNPSVPFGGIQVVASGDFLQLPPVEGKYAFQNPLWNTVFGPKNTIYFKEVFRQKDAALYARLNRLRLAQHTDQDNRFWSAQVRQVPPEIESQLTRLFSTNADADVVNKRGLLEVCPNKAEWLVYEATSICHDISDTLACAFVANMQKSCLARPKVVVAVGARVMLVANLKEHNELVNGCTGVIVGVKRMRGPRGTSVLYPEVEFDVASGGVLRTVIQPFSWNYMKREKVVARYTQVPLLLCYSISVHKAQGMTLDKLAITCNKVFDDGQAYVAFSRMTNLENCYITSYDPKAFTVNPFVKAFYEALDIV